MASWARRAWRCCRKPRSVIHNSAATARGSQENFTGTATVEQLPATLALAVEGILDLDPAGGVPGLYRRPRPWSTRRWWSLKARSDSGFTLNFLSYTSIKPLR